MLFRASLPLLAAALVTLPGKDGRSADTVPVPLEAASSLRLQGGSTVKDWTCRTSSLQASVRRSPPVRQAASLGNEPLGRLTVPVATLDCGNGHMESDLRKAVDAAEHPDIAFQLTGYRMEPVVDGVRGVAYGRLSLAGVTRTVDVGVRAEPTDEGVWRAVGSIALRMSDFGIRPPTAFFGLIKAKDRVVVTFDLRMASGTVAGVRGLLSEPALPPVSVR